MNNQIEIPGYVVNIHYPVQSSRNKSFTFRDSSLLNGRQAAFQKAKQIATEKSPNDAIDIKIDLVEMDRTSTSDKHPVIANVYCQRFFRTSFIEEGKDLLLDVDRKSLFGKTLPESLFLTIDLGRNDEACNSLPALWSSLAALAAEYEYHRNQGHSMGFGSVDLADITTLTRLRESLDPASMSDQQLRQCLKQMQQETAKVSPSYTVLYDGFTYAANLINTYNQLYAEESTVLCFRTDFLGQQ